MAGALTDVVLTSATLRARVAQRLWGGSLANRRKRLRTAESSYADSDTPYGPVVARFDIDGVKVEILPPFAFLHSVCSANASFARFFLRHVPHAQSVGGEAALANICIYLDDTRPGNALNTGPRRSYYAIYWTILELPEWFRSGPHGWFPLCFVKVDDLKRINGYVSRIVALIMLLFFHPTEHNMERLGMSIPVGEAAPAAWFRATFVAFVADEKAHAELCSGKGASAKRPCLCCQNIVGREDPDLALPGALVHWACGDYARWIPQTPETLNAMADMLATEERTLSDAQFERLQKMCGITYDPSALLWTSARYAAKLPSTTYWDWMHNLVASGGVAQYKVNQFLRRVRPHMPLEYVESFLAGCTWPAGVKKKPRFKFHTWTLIEKDKAHIKMYASELLQLIEGLGALVEAVLHDVYVLREEVECFRMLVRICYLLRSGDIVLGRLGLLRALLSAHHEAYIRVYPACLKPKLHWLLHFPGCAETAGHNLSCFSGERLHSTSKKIANTAFSNVASSLTTRIVTNYMTTLSELSFKEVRIKPTEHRCPKRQFQLLQRCGVRCDWYDHRLWDHTLPELRSALPMLYHGLGLRTPRGSVHKGDVMMYWQGPTLRAAFMLGAFRAVQAPPHDETFLIMHPLTPTEDARRFRLEGRVGDVACPLAWVHFAAAVCWYPLDDGLIHCVRGTDFD